MNGSGKVDVVIVGAGAAGIAAGCRLLENDFQNFVILEANNRIGGRLHTIPMGKGSLDLGAEWVHGQKGNPVYELASGLDLLYIAGNPFDTAKMFQSTGKPFDSELSLILMGLIDEIIDHCDPKEVKAHKGSLGEFFTERYWPKIQPYIKEGKLTQSEAEDFLRWLEHVENSIDGSPSWLQTSTDEAIEYVKIPGEVLNAWKVGGYSTILDLITKKLPNPKNRLKIEDKISLEKEVKRIDWSGDRVKVTCADGSEFDAERVIVTVSLNVLKAEARNIFHPGLPEKNLNAIRGLGMGTVDKIFLEFPYRWWEPDSGGVSLVWRAEDLARVPKELEWTTGVFGFYTEDNHPLSVLCGWIVGAHAEAMEKATEEEVLKESLNLLRRFVGPSVDIPDPVSMHRSKWHSNPFVRGSYSCRMVTSNNMDVWPAHLANPLSNNSGKQVVFFAGEATHDHYFSTVHGAIETGWREADRILSYQNKGQRRTVVIVGAGIAGLAAATALSAAGVDFIVLEAQEQPGGRIKTADTKWGCLELGAQWLHGENSALHRLAELNGFTSRQNSKEGTGRYCRSDGSIVPYNLVSEVNTAFLDILSNCESFVKSSRYPESVGAELEQKFGEFRRKSESAVSSGNIMDELFKWNERFQLIDNSCDDLRRLSAKSWGQYQDCGEHHCINMKNGFGAFIDSLVKKLPANSVVCNTPVWSIEWQREISAGSKVPAVKINTNSVDILANHVIVTCSLGVLKQHKTRMFHPPLPEPISKAIDLLGFGSITKLFLAYDKPWWSLEDTGFQLVWKENAALSKAVPWADGITGFDVLPGRPVLLGWVGGPSSSVVEATKENKLKEEATELLRRFTTIQDIPLPSAIFKSTWAANEYVRGAYSHITSDCDEQTSIENLAQPVYTKLKKGSIDRTPSILLAGEACHTSFYSTVHGAYDSGREQAAVIIDYLKKAKSKL